MALTVGDVMTHNVITVSPQTPVTEAAERLAADPAGGSRPYPDRRPYPAPTGAGWRSAGRHHQSRRHRAPHRDALDLFGLRLLRAWPAATGPLSHLRGHHARVYAGTRARGYVVHSDQPSAGSG